MACLFGHKWNGCKCEKCGKTRDDGHSFLQAEEKCVEICSICGAEREGTHKYALVQGKDEECCSVCGITHMLPHRISGGACELCGKGDDELSECLIGEINELLSSKQDLVTGIQDLAHKYKGLKNLKDLLTPACKVYGESFAVLLDATKNVIPAENIGSGSPFKAIDKTVIPALLYRYMEKGDPTHFPSHGVPAGGSTWAYEKHYKDIRMLPAAVSSQYKYFPNQTDFKSFIEALSNSFIENDYRHIVDLQIEYAVRWIESLD